MRRAFRIGWVDVAGGVLVAAVGLAGLAIARRYGFGTPTEMGPGFLPRIVAGALVLLGLALVVRAAVVAPIPWSAVRPRAVAAVTGAMVLFALMIESAGLAASTATAVAVAATASGETGWRETALLALGLSVAAILIFVVGLGQPIPIWPR